MSCRYVGGHLPELREVQDTRRKSLTQCICKNSWKKSCVVLQKKRERGVGWLLEKKSPPIRVVDARLKNVRWVHVAASFYSSLALLFVSPRLFPEVPPSLRHMPAHPTVADPKLLSLV